MTIRSGRMKSATAAPSFRNSGLDTTVSDASAAAPPRARSSAPMAERTASAVPTGTVDLSTTTLKPVMCRPMLRAAASTWRRSAEPSSPAGVPTAMNWISPWRTLAATSVEKFSRPALRLRRTSSSRPCS